MGFPDWPTNPIPNFNLSSSGIVAIADLSTVAQRTAIVGGSSWFDALVVAPGLHYQQAAEDLAAREGKADRCVRARWGDRSAANSLIHAVEERDGEAIRFPVRNAATASFIKRIARPGEVVKLEVGRAHGHRRGVKGLFWGWYVGSGNSKARRRTTYRMRRSESGIHATVWTDGDDEIAGLGLVSHLLYMASPVLTLAALVLLVLFRDWWGFGLLLALMVARVLNIWVIKQRAKPPEKHSLWRNGSYSGSESENDEDEDEEARAVQPPDGARVRRTVSASNRTGTGGQQSQRRSLADARREQLAELRRQRWARNRRTEYLIRLDDSDWDDTTKIQQHPQRQGERKRRTEVVLRGKASDLQAITVDGWLRARTHLESFLEAAAKLIVYMVAALSGNVTQSGAIVQTGLLVLTAALLALSNASANALRMRGRVAGPMKGGRTAGEGGSRQRRRSRSAHGGAHEHPELRRSEPGGGGHDEGQQYHRHPHPISAPDGAIA